jgi:bacillolysin
MPKKRRLRVDRKLKFGSILNFVVLILLLLLTPAAVSAGSGDPPFLINEALASDRTLQGSVDTRTENDLRAESARRLKTNRQHRTPDWRLNAAVLDRIGPIRSQIHSSVAPTPRMTDEQRDNLRRLNTQSGQNQPLQVLFNQQNGTPAFLKTKSMAAGSARLGEQGIARAERAARHFLRSNSQLLKLRHPDSEMALSSAWSDDKGAGHFRYQQMVDGIAVFGKQLIVHVDAADTVYLLSGRFEPTPEAFETTPAIRIDQAVDAIHRHLGVTDVEIGDPELVVYTKPGGEMVLTYQFEVDQSLTEAWTYFIDAQTAAVVHRMTRIHGNVVAAGGIDLNGNQRSFNAWRKGATHYLIDPSMPSSAIPSDPVAEIASPGNTYVLSARNGESDLFHLTSASATSGWDRAGVSLMANIRTVHNYYKNTFGYNGLDNDNRNYMGIVHLGQNYANAFWNGTFIAFGDGDGVVFSNLAASLDITAHEIQHGITQFSAGLKYENQSGALNEAYSDLLACMVDDRNWTVGEDVTLRSPGYLRNLADPTQGLSVLPRNMSEYRNLPNTQEGDWGGVHINMSIGSRAGYLMAEGLTAEGFGISIGRAKTAQIWFRALTTYLTPYAQFIDARKAQIQAAEDLYGAGSVEVAAVGAAWDVVEVFGAGGPPAPPSPTPGDAVDGEDMMVYLYPADGTHDRPFEADEQYHLYALLKAADGYVEANDIGPLNNAFDRPRYTKPAAYTGSDGRTIIFYATENYDLHAVTINANGTFEESTEVLATNNIFSIAISPNGRYFAYTTDDSADNHIYVLDLTVGSERTGAIALVSPNDTPGGDAIFNTIEYADSLSFDYTSGTLAFDALNCISTPDSLCSQGEGFRYWSIGYISLADDPLDAKKIKGSLTFPFPNQDPEYDLAYPAFAANNSYVLAVDLIDYSQSPTIGSMVWTINRLDGQARRVADPNLETIKDRVVYGVPTFWGDDDAVTMQRLNSANGTAYRVPIDGNWAGPAQSGYQGSPTITQLNDYAVAMPVMHRRADRSVSGHITFSATNVNFTNIAVGTRATQNLRLINNSARDVRIQNIVLEGASHFSHDGTNRLLPRESEMTLTIAYAPASAGTSSATLTFTSDADNPVQQIPITGTTAAADGGGGGGGGGGCMIATLTDARMDEVATGLMIALLCCLLIGMGIGNKALRKALHLK